jgi:predicted lipoprotein with Yx(FWY)xxD motif
MEGTTMITIAYHERRKQMNLQVGRSGLSRLVAVLIAVAASALLLAAASWARSEAGAAAVGAHRSSLGKVLVDSRGRTLYLFERDKNDRSACYGQCATFWPPLLTSAKPSAAAGVSASLLGTTRRINGSMQVTYAGHPLYRFAEDTKPGQTKGEGLKFFGGNWYVVAPSGKKIDKDD